MNFENKLISGVFIKRYKRFFVDVKVKNNVITTHCPNTGSMLGLLKKGNKVWISKSNNPKRKLQYTLQIIEDAGKKVGINTLITNKLVLEALKYNLIKEFKDLDEIKSEIRFNNNTRFDFLALKKNIKTFIEVKNVTLKRKPKTAEFPDTVTSRGAKHIQELLRASKKGYKIYLFFLIQREDCEKFTLAKDIDPTYYKLLTNAVNKKLKIICYDCKFLTKGIKLNRQIKLEI